MFLSGNLQGPTLLSHLGIHGLLRTTVNHKILFAMFFRHHECGKLSHMHQLLNHAGYQKKGYLKEAYLTQANIVECASFDHHLVCVRL